MKLAALLARQPSNLPLRALLSLRFTDQRPQLQPIASNVALRALAPTTLFQLPVAAQPALSLMARLCAGLPCHELALSRDHQANVALLTTLLDRQ